VAGGAGSLFAVRGAGPSSSLVGGAGPSLSTVGGVAGPLLFFVGGVAGRWSHCSWVVVCPCQFSCSMATVTVMVVLSSLKGEGGGSFMSVDAPSVIVLHWHPASFPCAIVMYPCSHVSSLLSCVPHHCRVSSPCRCPLPSSSLSRDVVVAMPSL